LRSSNRWLVVPLSLFCCGAGLAIAAEETAHVDGRVTMKGQGVGAVLVLINELKLSTETDADGRFIFSKVPLGTYSVVLTLGDDTAVHPLVISEAGTKAVEFEVDWALRGYEEVTVLAEELATKVVDAPAAITSIPAQQIEHQASEGQVPKLLEFTPGAEVTQSGLYDFNFNTRGFNSSLNRRVSTYIDGRDVGVVLLGAQEWAAIAGGLDDVANLEFVRGPSAALYGANASSGVVNITSKAPRNSLGGLFRTTVGELNTVSLDARQAFRIGGGWYGKVLGGVKNSGDFTVSRDPDGADGVEFTPDDMRAPEYSHYCLRVGEKDCLLEERNLARIQYEGSFAPARDEIRYGAARFDKYLTDASVMTFEAGFAQIKGPVFLTGIGRVQNLKAQRPFFRFAYTDPHWSALAHYSSRDGQQQNLTKALVVDYDLDTQDKRYGVEAQGHWSWLADSLRFVIGGAYTEEHVNSLDADTGLQTVVYAPIHAHRQAVFTQLDWRANEHFKLVVAAREDWSTLHSPQLSPKVGVVYSIDPTNSIRLTYNRAFQVANYSELYLHTDISFFPIGSFINLWCVQPFLPTPIDCGIPATDANGETTFIPILAVGNDDLKIEETEEWEIGYSGVLASKLFLTVDYYRAKNNDFITDLVPQVGTILGNTGDCVPEPNLPANTPEEDIRKRCPINADYLPWISTDEAETTLVGPGLTAAQAIRNSVQQSVGAGTQPDGQGGTVSLGLGFRLAQDLNGDPVIVGRTYANVGLVNTQGVDFGLQYFITPELNLQANYSWFDFEIVDVGDLQDLRDILLPNTPEHKGSLGLSMQRKRWSFTAAGRWVQGFRWSAGVFAGEVPSYTTMDVGATWQVTDLVQLGLNVANATDKVHRQTFGGDQNGRRALVNMTLTW
jgi:outer membrane receptor protein involved in Fe transport